MRSRFRSGPFKPSYRRGASVVEAAITLSAMLVLLTALLDLGLAAMQFNALGHACRLAAREAALRGAESLTPAASLGPTALSGHAGDGSQLAQLLAARLPTMPLASVSFSVTWPDGDNGAGDRVHVRASYTRQPIVPLLAPWGALDLTAASTMRIVN